MYQRILVPVDGSETSSKALAAALQMAGDSGDQSQLRLVFVTEEVAWLSGYDTYGTATEQMLDIMRENGQKILAGAMAVARSAGVQTDQVLIDRAGQRLGETVAAAASKWQADLIVVGTHGRHGVDRVLMGSGAEQIIRLAPVPVLVIRASGASTPRTE